MDHPAAPPVAAATPIPDLLASEAADDVDLRGDPLAESLAWARSVALQAARQPEPAGVLGGARQAASTAVLTRIRAGLTLSPAAVTLHRVERRSTPLDDDDAGVLRSGSLRSSERRVSLLRPLTRRAAAGRPCAAPLRVSAVLTAFHLADRRSRLARRKESRVGAVYQARLPPPPSCQPPDAPAQPSAREQALMVRPPPRALEFDH